jgi:glutamine---fructose-6-phosphate transaminase (isomerizing)
VIAKLIGEYYEKQMEGNKSVKDATEQALSRCDGSWGLCVMWTDAPDQLVVARNGSPLVIGIGYLKHINCQRDVGLQSVYQELHFNE